MSIKHIFVFLLVVIFSSIAYCDTNVLINPGFENGNTSGWSSYWGGSIGVVFTPVRSGNYAARAYGGDWWQAITQDLAGKMAIGESYQISAWVRTNSFTANDIDLYIVQTDNDGTNYHTIDYSSVDNSGWVNLSGNFDLEPTGMLSEIRLLIVCWGEDIQIYIDDVNVFGPEAPPPAGSIDANTRHQLLEGFGASGAWNQDKVANHASSQEAELYDVLFIDSGLDIYRDRNSYGYDNFRIQDTAQIVAQAKNRNPDLKVMLSSWSPPGELKSNGTANDGGTLKKDEFGDYMYDEFAQWWYNSLNFYSYFGVVADYISIQNEPNYVDTWETCLFDPVESPTVAGYNVAFETVWQKLNSEMGSSMPKMLAAEVRGIWLSFDYFDNLINPDHVYGYAHHLYGDTSHDNPNGANDAMYTINRDYGDRPLMQTEFSKGDTTPLTWDDAMNLAVLMHNSMTIEEVSQYLYWELFWTSPKGLVSVSADDYSINSVYYAFKHFAYFTDPGWQRVDTSTNNPGFRMSAYISPDNNNLSVVIINPSMEITDVNLSLSGFNFTGGEVYQSTASVNCELINYVNHHDEFNPITIPARSITTLALVDDTTPPSAPTGLTATEGDSKVDLDWDDNTEEDLRGYNVYRSTTQGSNYNKINDSLIQDSCYTDSNAVIGVTYYYVVTAADVSLNESGYSNEQSATPVNIIPPATPTGLTATAGDDLVELDWDDNSEGDLDGYKIYRSTTSGSGYIQINDSLVDNSKYTDSNATNNTIYYYKVTAVDTASNESNYSSEVSVLPVITGSTVLTYADFESGAFDSGWVNVTGEDTHDWQINSGSTPSSGTGPSGGANGSTYYAYLETSDAGAAGDTAYLQSPEIDGSNRILTFYYHMYGPDTGMLNVDVYDGSWNLGVWSISGNQHANSSTPYTQDVVDLGSYTGPIQIRFRAVAAGGYRGDIAIDDIQVMGINFQSCQDVWDGGWGLLADINANCYVDLQDLEVIAQYWLSTDCVEPEDCGKADLNLDGDIDFADYSGFAIDWLACNHPQDANCIHDWKE